MRYTENDRAFFLQSAEAFAPQLLGKLLCRRVDGGEILKVRICEVEAYGAEDTANYGYGYEGNGGEKKKTKANAPLFRQGGTCCIYGGMLLVVCGSVNKPDNVLIRGCADEAHWYSGPLKVADALKLNKGLHGTDLLTSDLIWLETDEVAHRLCRTERQGLGCGIKEADRKKCCRFITI